MTRDIRPGEVNVGRIQISEDKFKKLKDSGDIFESNIMNDSWYGASRSIIDNIIRSDKTVIMELEVNGVESIKNIYDY